MVKFLRRKQRSSKGKKANTTSGGGSGCVDQLLAMLAEGATPLKIILPTWCRFDSVEVGYPRTLLIVGGGIVAGQPETQRY